MGNASSARQTSSMPFQWLLRVENLDATGLTDSEKKAVRCVWNEFCKAHPNYGAAIFHAFFLKHPEHLNLFKEFRGRTLRTLAENPKFKAHFTSVGHEMTHMINALDKPGELLVLIRNVALLHHRLRDVKPAYFTSFGHTLIGLLQTEHKNLMTHEAKGAWHKLLEGFVRIVSVVYSEASRGSLKPTDSHKLKPLSVDEHGPGPAAESLSRPRGSKDVRQFPEIAATDIAGGSNASVVASGHNTKEAVSTSDTHVGKVSGRAPSLQGIDLLSNQQTSLTGSTKASAEGVSTRPKEHSNAGSGSNAVMGNRRVSHPPEQPAPDLDDILRRSLRNSVVEKAVSQNEEEQHEPGRNIRDNTESKKGAHSAAATTVAAVITAEVKQDGKKGTTAGPTGSHAAPRVPSRLSSADVGKSAAASLDSNHGAAASVRPPNAPVDVECKKRASANSEDGTRRSSKISIAGKAPSKTKSEDSEGGRKIRRSSELKHSDGMATAGTTDIATASVADRRRSESSLHGRAETTPRGRSKSDTTCTAHSDEPPEEDPKKKNTVNATDLSGHGSKISSRGKPPSHIKQGEHEPGHKVRRSSESNKGPNSLSTVEVASRRTSAAKISEKQAPTTGPTNSDATSVLAPRVSEDGLGERADTSLGRTNDDAASTAPGIVTSDVCPKDTAVVMNVPFDSNASTIVQALATPQGKLGADPSDSHEVSAVPSRATSKANKGEVVMASDCTTEVDATSPVILRETSEIKRGRIIAFTFGHLASDDDTSTVSLYATEQMKHRKKAVAKCAPNLSNADSTVASPATSKVERRERGETTFTRTPSDDVSTAASPAMQEAKPRRKASTTVAPTNPGARGTVASRATTEPDLTKGPPTKHGHTESNAGSRVPSPSRSPVSATEKKATIPCSTQDTVDSTVPSHTTSEVERTEREVTRVTHTDSDTTLPVPSLGTEDQDPVKHGELTSAPTSRRAVVIASPVDECQETTWYRSFSEESTARRGDKSSSKINRRSKRKLKRAVAPVLPTDDEATTAVVSLATTGKDTAECGPLESAASSSGAAVVATSVNECRKTTEDRSVIQESTRRDGDKSTSKLRRHKKKSSRK